MKNDVSRRRNKERTYLGALTRTYTRPVPIRRNSTSSFSLAPRYAVLDPRAEIRSPSSQPSIYTAVVWYECMCNYHFIQFYSVLQAISKRNALHDRMFLYILRCVVDSLICFQLWKWFLENIYLYKSNYFVHTHDSKQTK